MEEKNYTIVFQKLVEVTAEANSAETALHSEALSAEIDEIAELRRLVLEITDPEPTSYTTT
jgi:hypothetical protein